MSFDEIPENKLKETASEKFKEYSDLYLETVAIIKIFNMASPCLNLEIVEEHLKKLKHLTMHLYDLFLNIYEERVTDKDIIKDVEDAISLRNLKLKGGMYSRINHLLGEMYGNSKFMNEDNGQQLRDARNMTALACLEITKDEFEKL